MEQLPLLAKLNEVFSSTDDLMVTLLLDGSGSVSAQWEEVRQLSLDLVKKLENVDVQVIQFATAARTECPFTKNKDVLNKAIQAMKIMAGSTNMADGFKLARTSLFRSLTATSLPVIFFVTDGAYSGDHPGKEITALLKIDPAPTIVGIGIGAGVNVDQLRAILPGQQVFHMNDYAQLNKVIQGITVKEKNKEPAIKIEFLPGAKVQKSREDLMLQFKCEPDFPLDILPAGTKIHFLPSNFFFAEEVKLQHPAYRNKPVQEAVILKIKPEAKLLGEFPEKIWYEATIPGSARGCYRGYVQMLLGWLSGDFLYEAAPSQPINIMLWGPMGSGKSSFINGIATLFSSRQETQRPLMAYRSDTHVTKDYSRTAISDVLDESPLGLALKDKLKINFWDPWGLTAGGYKNLSLIHFLEGRIRAGTQLNDTPCNSPVDPDSIIHAIIFMIPIGTSQDAAMLDTLSRNIVTALDFRIYPKVVVNFINTVKSEAEVKKAFDTIQHASHLPPKDVFMLDNYDGEPYRNMDKDLQYWRIMQGSYAEAIKKFKNAPLPQAPTNRPSCQNSKCANLNKEVSTPRCPQCGELPVSPSNLVCVTASCSDYLKPVKTPRCGQCGNTTGSTPPPASKDKICSSKSCPNFKKPVGTPRCPFCGEVPQAQAPEPTVQQTVVTTKVCLNKDCTQHSQPVSFPRCPHCGKEPGFPTSGGRVCVSPGCANHGKAVDANFPRCPFCGNPPSVDQAMASLSINVKQVPRCKTSNCTNFNSEVPAQFACCPFCGNRPTLS